MLQLIRSVRSPACLIFSIRQSWLDARKRMWWWRSLAQVIRQTQATTRAML